MARRRIRAIFFDIDDTLYSTSAFAEGARRSAMEAMVRSGLRLPLEQVLAELKEVVAEFGPNYPFHYDRLLRRLPADALPHRNRALLVAAAVASYHDTKQGSLFPFPDLTPAMERVRDGTDLVLGCITEGLEVKQSEKLVRLAATAWMDPDAIFISDSIGISKPNVKLYLRACESVGVAPDEAMHVGDHPVNDVAAAGNAGMLTVRYRREGLKHAGLEGPVTPDHEIGDYGQLVTLLRDEYGFTDL